MKNLQVQPVTAALLVFLLALEFLGLKFLPEQKEFVALVGTTAMALTGSLFTKKEDEEQLPPNGQDLPK